MTSLKLKTLTYNNYKQLLQSFTVNTYSMLTLLNKYSFYTIIESCLFYIIYVLCCGTKYMNFLAFNGRCE